MAEYKLTFGMPDPIVVDSLPLSNWTIVNTNTLSINGDTITQLGIGGWYESMFVSFTVPENGSYKISYDYNITTAKVGSHGTYGFGLWLTTNNPNVSGTDQSNFYSNAANRTGSLIGVQNEDISGKHGTATFNANLTAGTTYYLWYPGAALDDGTTYTLTFTNIRIYNNPIKYNYNNLLVFNGWNGFITYKQPETILIFYPVGTLYKTVDETFDPNVTFGGVWTKVNFEGRTPIGYDSSKPEEGGEIEHTLTLSECPSHNHSFSRIVWASYNNDNRTGKWSEWVTTNGSYDKIANGTMRAQSSTDKGTHPNVQTSKIVCIWERIE